MAVIDFELGKKAIVQIYYAETTEIAGTGFWVGGRYLMTCAHVVAAALGVPHCQQEDDMKRRSIQLAFAEANQPTPRSAKVVSYSYQEKEGGQDAAVLRLSNDIDFECEPIHIFSRVVETRDTKVRSFGYAEGDFMGRNVEATTSGTVGGGGWLQADSSKTQGLAISEGFSGAPAWCDLTGLVGMVVAREKSRQERTGFIIPVTALSEPIRLVQAGWVRDILQPDEAKLQDKIRLAYEVCRGRIVPGQWHTELDRIVNELAQLGTGAQNKLLQFVACMVNELERPAFDALSNVLTDCAQQFVAPLESVNFDAVRSHMRDAMLAHRQQTPAAKKPALWVSVHAADVTGAPPFSIEAWLVLNPDMYDPQTGEGALKLSSTVLEKYQLKSQGIAPEPEESISEDDLNYDQICLFIASYLEQIGRGHGIDQADLTIELFLPLSLMNEPIERMGIPARMDDEPLGIGEDDCPHVLLRSGDRIAESQRKWSRWYKKWEQVTANFQTSATEMFAKDRTTLGKDLKTDDFIGFSLNASPSSSVRGEFYKLIKFGAPLAIWLRDNPHAVPLAQQLEDDLLRQPLQALPENVTALRRDTEFLEEADCTNSPELGHHLALLWENPKHVPPGSNVPLSSSQLA